MKAKFVLIAFCLSTSIAFAEQPQNAVVVSESSVDCGTKGERHKQTAELLCQEYVIHTETTEYHVRQPKQSNQALIPLNTNIQFTMNKDQMKFKANGKKYTFLVTSESALSTPKQP